MLFGVSAPLAKQLGGSLDPQLLAGLLSFGACVVIAPVALLRRGRAGESALTRADVGPLAGVVVLGGVLAPLLLMAGLQRTSGLSAVLLLNLEGPLTVLVGLVAFGEHLGGRAAASAGLIFGGAATLAVGGPVVGTAGLLGAAREAAVFAVAPLAGVVVSIVVLGERLTAVAVVAMTLMAVGVVVLVGDRHHHHHRHVPTGHDHRHDNRPGRDEHHRHEHSPAQRGGPAHAHPHRHRPLDHTEEHVSDAHHRHRHGEAPDTVASDAASRA